MPEAKTEVALQFSECCAAETALQHWLFCSAEVIWTKSCAAANEKLHCNIEKAALQESGAFLPLSCGFQAPTFRHPRFGPAEWRIQKSFRWKMPLPYFVVVPESLKSAVRPAPEPSSFSRHSSQNSPRHILGIAGAFSTSIPRQELSIRAVQSKCLDQAPNKG